MQKTLAAIAFVITAQAAAAQSCESNFTVEGTPMLTAVNYRSAEIFNGVSVAAATDRLARAMAAEGFSGIRVDRGMGTLTALQETSGSGRPQTLRVVARKSGKGARVDAVFMVQIGQMADAGTVRNAICRIVSAAGG